MSIGLGNKASFALRVENEGAQPDAITIKSTGSSSGYTLRYFVGYYDVTAAVTSTEGFTFTNIPGGGVKNMAVQITMPTSSPSPTPSLQWRMDVKSSSSGLQDFFWIGAWAIP